MARINYRGWNLPDGTEIPDVPADLQRMVDSTILNVPRFVAQRILASPQDAPQNAAWATIPSMNIAVTLNETHLLRLSAVMKGNVVTAAVNTPSGGIATAAANPSVLRLIANTTGNATIPVGFGIWMAGGVFLHQNAGTVTYTLSINGGGATGTVRFAGTGAIADSCSLMVEDYGVLV